MTERISLAYTDVIDISMFLTYMRQQKRALTLPIATYRLTGSVLL